MKPILIPYKFGGLRIEDREFTYQDIKRGIVFKDSLGDETILDPNWFGGNVHSFGKTKEGFLLCIAHAAFNSNDKHNEKAVFYPSNEVIGVYIPDLDGITDEGIELLEKAGYLKPEPLEEQRPIVETEEEELPKINLEAYAAAEAKVNEIVAKKVENMPQRPSGKR